MWSFGKNNDKVDKMKIAESHDKMQYSRWFKNNCWPDKLRWTSQQAGLLVGEDEELKP